MLDRKPNESEFEYKVRLCIAKLNKEIDLDWSEIAEMLGLDVSADHLRKVSYGYREFDEYCKNKVMNSDDGLAEKLIDIRKEQMKLYDLRTEVNRQIRQQARYENLLETVKYACDKMNEFNPFYTYGYEVLLPEVTVREGVLLISDIHYGQVIDNYWNQYDSDIYHKRMSFLCQRVIEIAKLHEIKKVNVLGLGDFVSGLIHTTTRLSNRESIAEQVLDISESISTMIYTLAKEIPYVTLSMTDDNHSRIFANKNENTDKDSFVPFMKEFIKMRIKGLPNVCFIENSIDSGIVFLNVCERTIVGVHGDKDRLGTAIPRMTSMLGQVPDYMCMAHYHNIKEDTVGNSELIVNGSFGGTDDYAKNLRLTSKPMQKFMVFSKEYGRECTYNIELK